MVTRFFLAISLAVSTFLVGCAVPFPMQTGGFSGVARDPASGSVIAFGGSGSNYQQRQPQQQVVVVNQQQRQHPGVIVNNLDANLCPGGYRHNGAGWTCPGGQIVQGWNNQPRQQFQQRQQCAQGYSWANVDGNHACFPVSYLQGLRRTN